MHEHVAVEHVNAHGSLEEFLVGIGIDGAEQLAAHAQLVKHGFVLWFLDESVDAAIDAALHNPELGDVIARHGFGRERDLGPGLDVLVKQDAKIHPVKLVAAQDQIIGERAFEEVAHVLPDGIGRALIPVRTLGCLLRGQNLDEAAGEIVELVARSDVSM